MPRKYKGDLPQPSSIVELLTYADRWLSRENGLSSKNLQLAMEYLDKYAKRRFSFSSYGYPNKHLYDLLQRTIGNLEILQHLPQEDRPVFLDGILKRLRKAKGYRWDSHKTEWKEINL